MTSKTIRNMAFSGIMIAFTFLATIFTRIPGPVPPGYLNFGDVVIMVAALVAGRYSGLAAGAIGSALADIASGGLIFAPITFVVKGLEGYVAGLVGDTRGMKRNAEPIKVMAVLLASVIMVGGYFLAETYILSLFDSNFGLAAAFSELPMNLIQGGVSSVVGYGLVTLLDRVNVRKLLE